METLNLAKSYDFFRPEEVRERIHIIGCGSVGSSIAELLARFGLTKLTLYDFDIVEPNTNIQLKHLLKNPHKTAYIKAFARIF